MVWINTGVPKTGDNETDIRTALDKLFSYHSQYVAGLYNPVYASTFAVTSVEHKGGGKYIINMSGSYVKSGDKCDKGRVRDQIWMTIKQFPGIKAVEVYVNGNLLGDILAVEG